MVEAADDRLIVHCATDCQSSCFWNPRGSKGEELRGELAPRRGTRLEGHEPIPRHIAFRMRFVKKSPTY